MSVQPPISESTSVETEFFALMMGAESIADRPLAHVEVETLRALRVWIGDSETLSKQVPRLPVVLPQLLKALNRGQGTAKELAQLIGHDPTMVAEVIRTANSPYYRTRREITSIEGAVIILGVGGMRETIARVALHPIIQFDSGYYKETLAKYVWEQANKSAYACSALAGKTEEDQFHAFLAGLLHNVGATILFRAIGREMGGMAPPACEAFHRVVEATLPLLSCRIAHGWDMPNPVVAALNPANADLPLRRIVAAAVLLAKVHTLVASERYPVSVLEEQWLDDVELQKHQDDVFAELDRYAP